MVELEPEKDRGEENLDGDLIVVSKNGSPSSEKFLGGCGGGGDLG